MQENEQSLINNSVVDSFTPNKMINIIDWSKTHVTPGDSKNIFP